MRKLLILTAFAALAFTVSACEENVQLAGAQALTAAPGSSIGDEELQGELKVVYVDGVADHCILVIPGTDTPISMASIASN